MNAIVHKIMHTWWLRHLLFWFAIWNYNSLGMGMTGVAYTKENLIKAYANGLRYLPGFWLVTYPLLYVFIPKLLIRRKYFLFALSYLAMIFLVGGAYANQFKLTVSWAWTDFTGMKLLSGRNMMPFIHMSGIAIAIKFIKKAYTEEFLAAQSETQKASAELELLKAQIHPHFLFNTLNNLFAHTLKHSNDAPKIVVKLSDLLRFMIYDSRQDMIPLAEEIQLVRNYIDLEALRYGDEMNCQLDIEGNPEGYLVRPLLLIPLIENSFKHGMSIQTGNKWIHMRMAILQDALEVQINNSHAGRTAEQQAQSGVGGVGIENVKKRLQLLYPGTHQFTHEDKGGSYHVYLRFPLTRGEGREPAVIPSGAERIPATA